MNKETWTVVVAEPGKKAEVRTIPANWKTISKIVGGPIEHTWPFSDDTAVLCNEEGKLTGLQPNRIIYDEDGTPIDVYCGTIVCIGARAEDDDFSSLTELEAVLYLMLYGDPDITVRGKGQSIYDGIRE